MAEFIMADMAKKNGIEVYVDSCATSTEELGNRVHYDTVRKLDEKGIPHYQHHARQLTKADYGEFDLLIGMDSRNLRNISRIIGSDTQNKVRLLLDFTDRKGEDIADPWYTGNFDVTYNDIEYGCKGLMEYIKSEGK